jgi:hypothetical protein
MQVEATQGSHTNTLKVRIHQRHRATITYIMASHHSEGSSVARKFRFPALVSATMKPAKGNTERGGTGRIISIQLHCPIQWVIWYGTKYLLRTQPTHHLSPVSATDPEGVASEIQVHVLVNMSPTYGDSRNDSRTQRLSRILQTPKPHGNVMTCSTSTATERTSSSCTSIPSTLLQSPEAAGGYEDTGETATV